MDRDLRNGGYEISKLIALALLAFVVLNVIAVYLCQEIVSNSSFRLSHAGTGKISTDVLVAGNSRGVNLVDGSVTTTPRAFNLSYNGLARNQILATVQDYYRAGNKAQFVVVEVSGILLDEPHCELKTYWTVLPTLESASSCSRDQFIGKWFPLTLYNSELFLRALYYWADPRLDDQAWANDYRMANDACVHPPISAVEHFAHSASAEDVAQAQEKIQWLRNWLERNYHAKIVFVLAPFLPTPDTEGIVQKIRTKTDQILGPGHYLDLTKALPRKCSLFSDALHINRSGRAILRGEILTYAMTNK